MNASDVAKPEARRRDDRTTQMRTRAVGMRDTLTAGYLTWAADEIDRLRAALAPDEVNEEEAPRREAQH